MEKRLPALRGTARFNSVSVPANILISALFIILALSCLIPMAFVTVISLSSDTSIQLYGYRFIPEEWSLNAYDYLWKQRDAVGLSLLMSVAVTVCGTATALILDSTMGYVLSRPAFRLRGLYTIMVLIPMLFGGGLVASYLVYTRVLMLKNTFWALILPGAVSGFYVIVLRTFFRTTVPDSIIESAKIDGASQLLIFVRIVLPISLPALATVGLLTSFVYWNDWFTPMMYIDSTMLKLYPLQYTLYGLQMNLQFLTQNMQYMSPDVNTNLLPMESARMAMVVLAVAPIACSYPFFQKYFVSGLTIGSVKG